MMNAIELAELSIEKGKPVFRNNVIDSDAITKWGITSQVRVCTPYSL